MAIKGKKRVTRTRRDRWADWLVLTVVAVALFLGWGVMTLAEGQQMTFTDEQTGLALSYPRDWFLKSDENLVFQVLEPSSGAFHTTYQVRVQPIAAAVPLTPTLTALLNDGSLSRAQEGSAYRLFDVVEGPEVDGEPTMEATYAYVVENADMFSQHMPVVVEGLDVALARGDRAYIYSLLATSDSFEDAQAGFRKFVAAAQYR